MNIKIIAYIASLIGLISLTLSAAEKLEDGMRESGWDRILGTWADAETNGKKMTTTYAWRFKGTVIEETTRIGDKEYVSLISRNAKTGEIIHMSADNQGGTSIGIFKGTGKGKATLGVMFTTEEGEQGSLNVHYRFEDDDTLVLTVESDEPMKIRLKRDKDKKKVDKNEGKEQP